MRIPFERVVAEHGATVLRVCRAVLPGTDADDAWSETFLSAMKAWPELPEDANVEAWLVTIAHRRAIDVTRRRRETPLDPQLGIGERGATRAGGSAATVTMAADPQDRSNVWELVAELPDRQRQAIAYHYLGGLPHAEVAKIIGGNAASVRRAAADGIKKLRGRTDEL